VSADEFYATVLRALKDARVPFLLAGAFALEHYTGVSRRTKDLDVFLPVDSVESALLALRGQGFRTELTSPTWLAKAFEADLFVDLIFNAGNGQFRVERNWIDRAPEILVYGVAVRVCPVEEMIISKAFVMDRERFDGADIMHLLRQQGDCIDWAHLLASFGEHWRLLLVFLVLFGYVYPQRASVVPGWVLGELKLRLGESHTAEGVDLCRGTLLSRTQYAIDVDRWGHVDARLTPHGELSRDQIDELTEELREKLTG
jgi:predicted nucleotidyltransferase